MRIALKNYVSGANTYIDFPIEEFSKNFEAKSLQFHLLLKDVEDYDVINFLNRIKKGYRNSFLKNLLRYYLAGPAILSYISDLSDHDKYTILEMRDIQLSHLQLEGVKKKGVRDDEQPNCI